MVVPVFADESWTRRVSRRSARDAGASVGHMVSARWKAAKFYSWISVGRPGSKWQGGESISVPNGRVCHGRERVPRESEGRWTYDFMGPKFSVGVSRHA